MSQSTKKFNGPRRITELSNRTGRTQQVDRRWQRRRRHRDTPSTPESSIMLTTLAGIHAPRLRSSTHC